MDLVQQEQNKVIRIGFDIDNTITDCTSDSSQYEYNMLQTWRTDIKKIGPYTGRVNPSGVEFLERYPDINKMEYQEFMEYFFPRMVKEAPFRQNISKLFDTLQEPGKFPGYTIKCDIITRRDDYYQGPYSGPMMKEDTIERFKNEKIHYDRIFFNCKNKKKTMEENNIDILVDDSPMNIFQVSTKFPVIVCATEYNKKMIGKNIYLVRLEDYNLFIMYVSIILEKMSRDENR